MIFWLSSYLAIAALCAVFFVVLATDPADDGSHPPIRHGLIPALALLWPFFALVLAKNLLRHHLGGEPPADAESAPPPPDGPA